MTEQGFENLADAYEAMIDWPKRLANEEPFFRWLFDRVDARSVLDVACGTGHHASLFHSWNLRVEGADLSDAMIGRCRQQWGQSDSRRWSVRRFDQPVDTPALFDAAICIGNSLALAPDLETVSRALQQMLAAVRVGGAVVIQVVNLWRLPEGQVQWQKCKRAKLPQGDSLIIKGIHRCGDRGYVDLLVTDISTDRPQLASQCVQFVGLETDQLQTVAKQAGATQIEFFGGYDRREYDRQTSQDVLMVVLR